MRYCLLLMFQFHMTFALSANRLPNIILILTDDQDTILGGMTPMKATKNLITRQGANFTNYFTSTPVCCPSRSELLTGRYAHNYTPLKEDKHVGCMANEKESFAPLLSAAGYALGMYGKYLNMGGMKNYCPNIKHGGHDIPKGWDKFFAMCPDTCYVNCTFADNGKAVTPTDHDGYHTAIIGNRTLNFINKYLKLDKPFFVYVAPHAPHLPSTPAPWYANAFPKGVSCPRTPSFNISAPDHHWLVAQQPALTKANVEELDDIYVNRWRTLLSVDDIVTAVYNLLDNAGVLNNTYIFVTSDHGFHLGQFRLGPAKRQVYDTDLRIPLSVFGPGIQPGTLISSLAVNVDLAPTFLDIAHVEVPLTMDGTSLLPMLTNKNQKREDFPLSDWRNAFLVEYQGDSKIGTDKIKHIQRGPNNTYTAIRVMSDIIGNLLFAEFTGQDYDFTTPYFYELYNLTKDPYQITNLYYTQEISPALREELHTKLQLLMQCKGHHTNQSNSCFISL